MNGIWPDPTNLRASFACLGARRAGARDAVRRVLVAAFAVTVLVLTGGSTPAAADTTTYANDLARTGWYPDQPKLTPAAVTAPDFGRLWEAQLDGPVYGQPLVHENTLITATGNNVLYGLDVATGATRWQRSFGVPWTPTEIGCAGNKFGVTSTPVIDPATDTVYTVSKSYVSGTSGPTHFVMHANSTVTGAERAGFPVELAGIAQNNPSATFSPTTLGQRPALLLMNGVVYAAFGGLCDKPPFRGWIFGVSTSGSLVTRWVANSGNKNGAGIWQSAGGIASDRDGEMLIATGNGSTQAQPLPGTPPPPDLGQAVVRLRVQPGGTLAATDFFSPYDARQLDLRDADFGSGAPMALPSAQFGTTATPNLMVAVGKQGYVYLLDRDRLGGIGQGPAGSDDVVDRSGPYGGVWSKPSVWPGDGGWVYMPTTGFLNFFKYGLTQAGRPSLTLATQDTGFAYGSSPASITSTGTTTGSATLWIHRVTDAAGGELRAYDANPRTGSPKLLFSANVGRTTKWVPPGISGGKVFTAGFTGRVVAFGSPVDPVITSSDVDFGAVTVGQAKTSTATITAARAVTVSKVSIGAPFSLGAPSRTLPATLTPGQTITVPITFRPTEVTPSSTALTVTTSEGAGSVNVRGTGLAEQGRLVASTPKISFGGVRTGGELSETVTWTNVGAGNVNVLATTPPAPPFSTTNLPAAGTVIRPGQSIITTVRFRPVANGDYDDEIELLTDMPPYDDPNGPPTEGEEEEPGVVSVGLGGNAAPGPVMTLEPRTVAWGNVPIGETVIREFTIKNTGGTTLTLNKSKPPFLGAFSALEAIDEGVTIPAGGEIQGKVVFAPTSLGAKTDEWVLTADDNAGVQAVTFTGTGVPAYASATVKDGVLRVDGGAATNDVIDVSRWGSTLIVNGHGNPVKPLAGCFTQEVDVVTCANAATVDLYGNAGNDELRFSGSIGGKIVGGSGNDEIYGGANADRLYGGSGDDGIHGLGGDDFEVGDSGSDTFWGGNGSDTVSYAGRTAALSLSNNGARDDGSQGEGDKIDPDIEVLEGGNGPDSLGGGAASEVLRGGAGNDRITGGGGADRLEGGAADDTLAGGTGDDYLTAGAGNDLLDGGTGTDQLWGGAGIDRLTYAVRRSPLYVELKGGPVSGEVGENDRAHSDIEDATTGAGKDVLVGNESANRLDPGAGADSVSAGGGNDTLTLADGARDDATCGSGDGDLAVGDVVDTLRDCELRP